MRYLVNGTLRADRTRDDLLGTIKGRSISDDAWELVRSGAITEHAFKIGPRPGFFLIIEGDSEATVRATIAGMPAVRDGWFEIDVDPISRFMSDFR